MKLTMQESKFWKEVRDRARELIEMKSCDRKKEKIYSMYEEIIATNKLDANDDKFVKLKRVMIEKLYEFIEVDTEHKYKWIGLLKQMEYGVHARL